MQRSAQGILCIDSEGRLLTCVEEEDELVHEPGHARDGHLQREHQQAHEPTKTEV